MIFAVPFSLEGAFVAGPVNDKKPLEAGYYGCCAASTIPGLESCYTPTLAAAVPFPLEGAFVADGQHIEHVEIVGHMLPEPVVDCIVGLGVDQQTKGVAAPYAQKSEILASIAAC